MSYGAYTLAGKLLFAQGVWTGELQALNSDDIKEDINHGWMLSQNGAKHPYQGTTLPNAEQSNGYSWCKAHRLAGKVMEVGALATHPQRSQLKLSNHRPNHLEFLTT